MKKWRYSLSGAISSKSDPSPSGWSEDFPKVNILTTTVYAIYANFYMDGSMVDEWSNPQQVIAKQINEILETPDSSEYHLFKTGSFEPAFKLNLKTGESAQTRGVFSGSLRTSMVPIDQSDATVLRASEGLINPGQYFVNNDLSLSTNGEEVVLPVAMSLAGTRVTICDSRLTKSGRHGTRVMTQDGGYIGGIQAVTASSASADDMDEGLALQSNDTSTSSLSKVDQNDWGIIRPSEPIGSLADPIVTNPEGSRVVEFVNGVVVFICVPCTVTVNSVKKRIVRWFIESAVCSTIYGKA